MLIQRHHFKILLVISGLALASASVQARPPGETGSPPLMLEEAHFPGMQPEQPPAGRMSMAGLPMPPYLRTLRLDESQQDQVFKLLYKMAPQLRERSKTAFKTREALRSLALSSEFDEAEVKTLAMTSAGAEAEIAMLHAYIDHAVMAILTPAQRDQVLDQMKHFAARRIPQNSHRTPPPRPDRGPAQEDRR